MDASTISLVATAVSGSTKAISGILQAYKSWKDLAGNDGPAIKLRLLYLETKENLGLLDTLYLSSSKLEISQDDIAFRNIIPHLETSILEMIFMEGIDLASAQAEVAKSEQLSVLQKIKIFVVGNDDVSTKNGDSESKDNESKEEQMSLVQACAFVAVRISILKKLASTEVAGAAQANIHYRRRLQNIKSALLGIVNHLGEHPALKDFVYNPKV